MSCVSDSVAALHWTEKRIKLWKVVDSADNNASGALFGPLLNDDLLNG
jgi:hypothetical protein